MSEDNTKNNNNNIDNNNPTTEVAAPLASQTISIVSLDFAAKYHQVSRQAIHKQIQKGTFQSVKGIPLHQLDNYKPDRKAQEHGKRKVKALEVEAED